MAISYKDIRSQRQWRASTGLSEETFKKMVSLFKSAYEDFHEISLAEQISQRIDEPKFKSYEDIVFFLLYSLKSGLTYDLLALNFDLSRSVVFEQQASQIRILQMALQQNNYMPRRQFESFEDLQAQLKDYDELLIDGTEQRRQRAVNQEDQKDDYSGKKKDTP